MSRKTFKKHIDLLLIEQQKQKNTMFLSKILILSCIILVYIVEKSIFVVIVWKLSTEEIVKSDVNDCFKINGKQLIQMLKEGEYIKLKNNCKKNKIIISDLCKFWKHFDAKR